MPLTSLLVADDQEKLPTGQCRPRVPPSPINLRGEAYLSLQKVLGRAQVRKSAEKKRRSLECFVCAGLSLVSAWCRSACVDTLHDAFYTHDIRRGTDIERFLSFRSPVPKNFKSS